MEHPPSVTAIGFYHLTRTDALAALPMLLGRTLAAGQRAMVACGGMGVEATSAALWASTNPDWLPHGSEGQGGRPEWQPIWLTATDTVAPNGARFLFLIGDAPHLPGFDRIFDLFDGNNPDALVRARQRWSAAKGAGYALTYWQQGERGWAAKA